MTQNNEVENNELKTDEVEEISIKDLNEEIERLKAENEKYYEHLQRTAAEFDNYKKRVSKEKERTYNLAVGDIIIKVIPVLDSLDKAILTEKADTKSKEGIELIHKQMNDILTSIGVENIPTVNETFNPEFHDAVMHVEDEKYGEKEIIEELRCGYKFGDRVLRHAMVKVAN